MSRSEILDVHLFCIHLTDYLNMKSEIKHVYRQEFKKNTDIHITRTRRTVFYKPKFNMNLH